MKDEKIAVIGAAGKMGRGIALLLLLEAAKTNKSTLFLIDSNEKNFPELLSYFKNQLTRYAEKNHELDVQSFVEQNLLRIVLSTDIQKVKDCGLIFEAIVEDIDEKVRLFSTLKAICGDDTYYMTNTSSIPIHIMNTRARLNGKIIGFHFYNPPAVQKLLEIIVPENIEQPLKNFAEDLGKRLNKIIVHSNDIAGFIGNGYFLREIQYACNLVKELSKQMTLPEAIYAINIITQDYLIRPMGIFQLLDYVGIDVCQKIGRVMEEFIPNEIFQNELIDQMVLDSAQGGQFTDGTQKNGFFSYEKNVPAGIYSLKDRQYLSIKNFADNVNRQFGQLPKGLESWKNLVNDAEKEKKLIAYFKSLQENEAFGCTLAKDFLHKSSDIAKKLVNDGVCQSLHDVELVLLNGFYHLYAPNMIQNHLKGTY